LVDTAIEAKHKTFDLRAYWDSAVVAVAVLAFHLWHVPSVAFAPIFRKSNLAFDFDIDRFVQLWCTSPFPIGANEDYYAVRHPLAVTVRTLCSPFVSAGLDAHLAACGVAAICAAASSVLAFNLAFLVGARRHIAYLLTALWTFSTSSLLLGVLPETYDLAFIALSYQFLLSVRWMQGHPPRLAVRVAAAVANFGITITNVALSGLTEFLCRLKREPFPRALWGSVGFSAAVGAAALPLAVISFLLWPVQNIDSPMGAVKQVYWSAASAENTTLRQSVGEVAWTLGVTSFIAPAPGRYPSGVPDNPYLWDLRGHTYSPIGWAAVIGWLSLLISGAIAATKDRERWPIWASAGLWAAGNIVLHTYWQFRDSVFLYAAHSHIAFFMIVLAAAASSQRGWPLSERLYAALLGVVTLLTAATNLPIYHDLARLN
jgi:hypothetical protein